MSQDYCSIKIINRMTGWAHAIIGTGIDWHYLNIVSLSDMVLRMITIIFIGILIIRRIIITICFICL